MTTSSNLISRRVFQLSDASENNHNKFWEAHLETCGVRCKWGRTGTTGQTKFYPGEGKRQFEARIREKTNKGYREVALVEQAEGTPAGAVDNRTLVEVAQEQIAQGDRELAALVKQLAEANRHEIVRATGGAITFNAQGMAQTALGVVQRKSVMSARSNLLTISVEQAAGRLDGALAMSAISTYMELIPQKVGARRGWHVQVFGTEELIATQFDLLDKLEQTIEHAEKEVEVLLQESAALALKKKTFEVKITRLTDTKEIARVTKLFKGSMNLFHAVAAGFRVKAIYTVEIPSMLEAFQADGAKVGNVKELWHGTRIHNVLSILKSGLVIPRATESHVCGRMFGDGLYFSDQSTKSANYSAGYWDPSGRSAGMDRHCFMFLADVAMGREYIPMGRCYRPPHGFDSVFAKAGESNVRNNEMIVYRLGQANLKYLLELER